MCFPLRSSLEGTVPCIAALGERLLTGCVLGVQFWRGQVCVARVFFFCYFSSLLLLSSPRPPGGFLSGFGFPQNSESSRLVTLATEYSCEITWPRGFKEVERRSMYVWHDDGTVGDKRDAHPMYQRDRTADLLTYRHGSEHHTDSGAHLSKVSLYYGPFLYLFLCLLPVILVACALAGLMYVRAYLRCWRSSVLARGREVGEKGMRRQEGKSGREGGRESGVTDRKRTRKWGGGASPYACAYVGMLGMFHASTFRQGGRCGVQGAATSAATTLADAEKEVLKRLGGEAVPVAPSTELASSKPPGSTRGDPSEECTAPPALNSHAVPPPSTSHVNPSEGTKHTSAAPSTPADTQDLASSHNWYPGTGAAAEPVAPTAKELLQGPGHPSGNPVPTPGVSTHGAPPAAGAWPPYSGYPYQPVPQGHPWGHPAEYYPQYPPAHPSQGLYGGQPSSYAQPYPDQSYAHAQPYAHSHAPAQAYDPAQPYAPAQAHAPAQGYAAYPQPPGYAAAPNWSPYPIPAPYATPLHSQPYTGSLQPNGSVPPGQ